jgi:hypothetical protein
MVKSGSNKGTFHPLQGRGRGFVSIGLCKTGDFILREKRINDALSDADTSKVPKRRNLMQGRYLEKVCQEETPDILKIVLCIVFALG